MSMFHSDRTPEQIQRHSAKRQKEAEYLTDRLVDWLANVSEDQADLQALDAILDELDEIDPMPDDSDSKADLEQFHQDYASIFAKLEADEQKTEGEGIEQKKPARHTRIVRKVILAAAVLLAAMVTAQAFGVDVFGALGRWTDETFHFGRSAPQAATVTQYPISIDENVEYTSLEEAIAAFGIESPIAPQWIPERFQNNTRFFGTVTPSGALIGADYIADGDAGILTITLNEVNETSGMTIEKDEVPPQSYYKGDCCYYIFFDQERVNVIWKNGNLLCHIYGMISEDEAKKMIDSIYQEVIP